MVAKLLRLSLLLTACALFAAPGAGANRAARPGAGRQHQGVRRRPQRAHAGHRAQRLGRGDRRRRSGADRRLPDHGSARGDARSARRQIGAGQHRRLRLRQRLRPVARGGAGEAEGGAAGRQRRDRRQADAAHPGRRHAISARRFRCWWRTGAISPATGNICSRRRSSPRRRFPAGAGRRCSTRTRSWSASARCWCSDAGARGQEAAGQHVHSHQPHQADPGRHAGERQSHHAGQAVAGPLHAGSAQRPAGDVCGARWAGSQGGRASRAISSPASAASRSTIWSASIAASGPGAMPASPSISICAAATEEKKIAVPSVDRTRFLKLDNSL